MPKKELFHPCLAARGTIATDITTLSALHKHITQAIKLTTFNLSGIAKLPSCPLPPTNPLPIPSAVHLTTAVLPPLSTATLFPLFHTQSCIDKFPHFCSILFPNLKRGCLKWIELKWVFDRFEDLELNVADLEVNAAMVMVLI